MVRPAEFYKAANATSCTVVFLHRGALKCSNGFPDLRTHHPETISACRALIPAHLPTTRHRRLHLPRASALPYDLGSTSITAPPASLSSRNTRLQQTPTPWRPTSLPTKTFPKPNAPSLHHLKASPPHASPPPAHPSTAQHATSTRPPAAHTSNKITSAPVTTLP